jgi:hypothetical protein
MPEAKILKIVCPSKGPCEGTILARVINGKY